MKRLAKLFGVSPVDAAKLEALGVRTVLDLAVRRDLAALSASSGLPLEELERSQRLAKRDVSGSRFRRGAVAAVLFITVVGVLVLFKHAPRPGAIATSRSYDEAYELYREGDTARAARVLDEALRHGENSPDAHNLRGVLYLGGSQLDSAIGEYRLALALDSTYSYAWNNLGNAYLDLNDTVRAVASYRKAVATAPHESLNHRNLAKVLARQQHTSREAISEYEAAIGADPNDLASYNALSEFYQRRGDSEPAERVLRRATQNNSHSPEAFASLAALYSDRRQYSPAGDAYLTAAGLQPDSVTYWSDAAEAFRLARRWASSLEAYREVIRRDSLNWDARFYRGWVLLQQGESSRLPAIQAFKGALAAMPTDKRNKWVYLNLAIAYVADSGAAALSAANSALDQALSTDARFVSAVIEKGILFANQGRQAEAEREFMRAIQIAPDDPRGYYRLYEEQKLTSHVEAARKTKERLLSRFPQTRVARFVQAGELEGQEKDSAAAALYEQILKESPDDAEALRRLAAAELQAGQRTKNVNLIQRGLARLRDAIRNDSTWAGFYFTLAWAYQVVPQVQNLDSAFAYYQRYLEYAPRDVVALNNISAIVLGRGDLDGIVALSRRVLAIDRANEDAFENLGYVSYLRGHAEEALHYYDSALVGTSRSADLLALRGEALLWVDSVPNAHAAIRKALSIVADPLSGEANSTWVRLLRDPERSGSGQRLVYCRDRVQKEALLKLLDGFGYVRTGSVAQAIGAFEEAGGALDRRDSVNEDVIRLGLAELHRVQQQIPAPPTVYIALGLLYEWLGDRADAAECWNDYLKVGTDPAGRARARAALGL